MSFLVLGIVLATSGWGPALGQRDAIVGSAQQGSILQSYQTGHRVQAALLDFASNTMLAALPTTVVGLTVVGPFPLAAYRGWVGGIVSVDARHRSRLASAPGAAYYLVTVALQLLGFALTMGAGLHLGLTAWRARRDESVRSFGGFRLPGFALADAAWIYALALPVFLAGSLYEFLA